MKTIFCRTALLGTLLSALLSATLLPTSAQAQTPTVSELLLIQQSVNTYCLGRGQGRARILCRCSAVMVSNKLATEGTAGYQENAETIFDQAFESCMSHEDKSFPTTTSRLYQSQPAVEESLRSTAAKP
jgi:hypothetical protein